MSKLNLMFHSKVEEVITSKDQVHKVKLRKTRSDKKKDIRINLTLEQKKKVKRLARIKNNMDHTNYSQELLKDAIRFKNYFPEVDYPKSPETNIGVRLEEIYYQSLLDLAIDWNVSVRKATHRVFMAILDDLGDL